jgi:hypothetical protein
MFSIHAQFQLKKQVEKQNNEKQWKPLNK